MVIEPNAPNEQRIDAVHADVLDLLSSRLVHDVALFVGLRTEHVPTTAAEIAAFGRLRDAFNEPARRQKLERELRTTLGNVVGRPVMGYSTCTATDDEIAAAIERLGASVDRDDTLTVSQRDHSRILIAGLGKLVDDEATRDRLRSAIVAAMKEAGA